MSKPALAVHDAGAEPAVPDAPVPRLRPAAPEIQAFADALRGADPQLEQRAAAREHAPEVHAEAPLAQDLSLSHRKDMEKPQEQGDTPGRPMVSQAQAEWRLAQALALPNGPTPHLPPRRSDETPRQNRRPLKARGERRKAVQPLLDLLLALLERAAAKPVGGMTIVPPAPNPLQLNLQLVVTGHDVIVKASTGLGIEHHDEVRLALAWLEQMLAEKLQPPAQARVMLLT